AARDQVAPESEPQQKRGRGRPRKAPHFGFDKDVIEELPEVPYTEHHQIAKDQRFREDLALLVAQHPEDPALRDFVPELKNHLLARLRGHDFNGEEHEFTDKDRMQVIVVSNRIYRHKCVRINYTTYDMRRDQDTINPRTRADVMVLNPGEHEKPKDEQHPYWYARVCGVFHANVVYTGPGSTTRQPQRMEFLWVRWFGIEPGTENPWKRLRLPLVGFVPDDELGAFGFLDPQHVIRGVHMILAFSFGR
ncbi:hypothetical protein EIP86_006448, partial [Pleurotus ostreatoroseus]